MSPPSSSSSSSAEDQTQKPWSSGRVLSRAQRDRKRQMNRVSQSRRRKNLKNTLKSLDTRLFQIEQRCLPFSLSSNNNPVAVVEEYTTFNDCISATGDDGTSLRDLLNDILGSIYHIDPRQVCTDDQFNQDVVIRGVILGWHVVLQQENFICPIWRILRRMDALLMMHAAVPTRLALLRGINAMLLGRRLSDKPPPLPSWFTPRKFDSPSSENVVNDYFAWPRFRERLITSNNPPLTNRFWIYFTRNVQFEWDLSPAHTIDIEPDSGKYRLTMVFRNATDEIQRYTMGNEFFKAYPECYDDVYGMI